MKKLKFDPLNIVICGIGGQGNVLASEIVASTMNDLGYRVAVGETYGASPVSYTHLPRPLLSLCLRLLKLFP